MRTRALLLGLVAGALGGLVLLSWRVGMPWLGLIAIGVGALAPPRPFGLAGTLVGWGCVWIALFLQADAACDPASCSGPSVAPWLAASAALVVAGLLITGVDRARGRVRP